MAASVSTRNRAISETFSGSRGANATIQVSRGRAKAPHGLRVAAIPTVASPVQTSMVAALRAR